MNDDDAFEGTSPESGQRPVGELRQLPLDFEALYLGHQEFFHAFAEIHLGGRRTAEEVVHRVFQDILATWGQLLRKGDLEQQTLAVLTRHVQARLVYDRRDPAYLFDGPIHEAARACASSWS
ncbi:hypothetical protein [Streptomyces sp. NBC_01497]|uniref:hypothetical protein n=1 Tax=Streptomyces sp. NBC_01497 TaxID=2903885 RepID=UPI002E3182F0|nr:hypothetical protein [Streptomyces sp. NBC_01497]